MFTNVMDSYHVHISFFNMGHCVINSVLLLRSLYVFQVAVKKIKTDGTQPDHLNSVQFVPESNSVYL